MIHFFNYKKWERLKQWDSLRSKCDFNNTFFASEIYLNSILLKKYGIVSSKKDEIRGFLPQKFSN